MKFLTFFEILLLVSLLAGCDNLHSPPTQVPSSKTNADCPVTPVESNFWSGSGSVAGEFPVWMTSTGQEPFSKQGPLVMPPKSKEALFEKGRLTKTLIFVDQTVTGDLHISGRQINGDGIIYFPRDDEIERVNETTLKLLKMPADLFVIANAQELNRSPNPPGKATHGMSPLYPQPGCYQFTFEISGDTVQIIIEITDE